MSVPEEVGIDAAVELEAFGEQLPQERHAGRRVDRWRSLADYDANPLKLAALLQGGHEIG